MLVNSLAIVFAFYLGWSARGVWGRFETGLQSELDSIDKARRTKV